MKKKIAYGIFIVAFFLICLLPSAGMLIFGESEAAANEILADRPAVMLEDGTFNTNITDDITDYIADRSALRQEFITVYAKIYAALFGESSSDDVILGEKGWLYYDSTKEDYLHINTLDDRSINGIARTLAMIQSHAESRGVKFAFTLAPNKSTVYPFAMPDMGKVSNEPNNMEKLESALAEMNVSYADIKGAVNRKVEEKYASSQLADHNASDLYHRLDSHWNNLGAALGLKVITDTLGVEAHNWFSERHVIRYDFKGDLYEMLYPAGKELDENMYFDKEFEFTYHEDHNGNVPAVDSIKISTINENKEGSLLMFRDSFGNALYPFMADSFGQAVFSRLIPYRIDWLDTMDVDYLVIEIVERNIKNLLDRAPVMAAPEIAADDVLGAVSSGDRAVNISVKESAELTGYSCISGNYDISGVDDDSRVYIMAHEDGTGNQAIRVYEACPVGAADAEGKLAGRFTAYIPSDMLNSGSISVILCCDGTLEANAVSVA